MDFSIPPFLAYVAAWGATIGAVWFLFEKAEDTVTPEIKQGISGWLRKLDPAGRLSNWPSMFAAVFDRVFGERHLSWRCFWRSCVASLVAIIIPTLVWAAIRPVEMTSFIQQYTKGGAIWGIFGISAILNFLPDYISLLESRYIIRWMSRVRSMGLNLILLAIDFVLTSAVFVVALFVMSTLIVPEFSIGEFAVAVYAYGFRLSSTSGQPSIGIWLYSTYFTSVWVWLYSLSGLAMRLAQFFGLRVHRLKGVLDIENKPLRSMGFVSIALVSLLFVVFPFLRLLGIGT